MELITDNFDFEGYFDDQQVDAANIKPAGTWVDEVIDSFHGEKSASSWQSIGWGKTDGQFELRPGELTIWAGVNGHGKTTFLSNVMLNVMHDRSAKVCLASLEMKPVKSMAKMARQAVATGNPSTAYIRAFHKWTDGRLWIYDRLGKVPAKRMLAVATYARKELKVDHMVIDSLMKCGLGTDDYTGQKDFVDSLMAIAQDTGLHIHLVCHMRKGEAETKAPDKFDVKGAGEIIDMADNLVIVWKNVRKNSKDGKDQEGMPDAYIRVAKQRHFEWEGSWAFWFDKPTQQFLEYEKARPVRVALEPHVSPEDLPNLPTYEEEFV